MRANVACDKVALARAKMKNEVACRRCHAQTETLGHVLGQCLYTKKDRIKRHDDIKDFILGKVVGTTNDAVVTREPVLRSPEDVLKPDLVIKNQEGVFVVDVTVRHEDGDYLRTGRQSKFEKYTPLLPDLRERFDMTYAEVLPIVIGTRGALPKQTMECLKNIGITGCKDLETISLMSLCRSTEIYNRFMDYNTPFIQGRNEDGPRT
jgi:hypothetical protein